MLYLAILFAPSGIYLLWNFPSWETMHVGDRNLPAWLVALFAITNVTQGILGYWVVYRLLRRGWRYFAFFQMYLGYLFMFFILVHGWDGAGYQRFFSAAKVDFAAWEWTNIPAFFVSDVGLTLYGMGVILVPVLLLIMTKWLLDGKQASGAPGITGFQLAKQILKVIFGGALVHAIVASLLIHLLGWLFGLLVFLVLAYAVAWHKGGMLHRMGEKMILGYS